MQIRRIFAGLFLSLSVIALTALAQDVSTDYDRKADFSKYRPYTWIHPPMIADPLMRQRVEDAINRQLQVKGLSLGSRRDGHGVDGELLLLSKRRTTSARWS